LFAAFAVVLLVYTAEKKFKEEKTQTFFQIFRLLPKFFTNSRLRNVLFYVFLTRFTQGFYGEVMTLQFLSAGIDRTTIVNIGTVLTPLALLTNCLSNKFLTKGKLVQYYHNIKIYGWVMNLLNFILLIYLNQSKNTDAGVWLIFILNAIGIVAD
jgi:hypothetical protein